MLLEYITHPYFLFTIKNNMLKILLSIYFYPNIIPYTREVNKGKAIEIIV